MFINRKIFISLLCLGLLTGCWDQAELPDYGFVQSIAIEYKKDRFKLTTQFYKPAAKIASSGGGSDVSFLNIATEGDTVFEAIRDITTHLGRKATWGHMRFILIDEKTAKKVPLNEVLEFFYRDHEPRILTGIALTKGEAPKYLKTKPHVENTISQQLNEISKAAGEHSGKTYPATLFTLGKQMLSEVGIAYVPYIKEEKTAKDSVVVAGLAVLKDGKLKKIFTPQETKYLMIGLNELKGAIIEVPCGKDAKDKAETFEVVTSSTNWKMHTSKNQIQYDGKVEMKVSIGELRCSSALDSTQIEKLNNRVAAVIEMKLSQLLKKTQKERLDVLGVGNELYRHKTKKWQSIKQDWDKLYPKVKFNVDTKVNIINSGIDSGEPFKVGG
ncbi:Ger(x)C family spore germination protein [Fictibacillus aquaticus]|uniref:Uncharacterized protein n=1 Tax=Fictibacillus aquaticus TaxID=2021314 RepID=A0A235F7D9_9BACL|nr:Ger(x)C family spore germination protein [Fictibacillus aquaticus]OYD56877.1 hypothetical protein CGZ90_15085 [Fictibacillus aquaticus]